MSRPVRSALVLSMDSNLRVKIRGQACIFDQTFEPNGFKLTFKRDLVIYIILSKNKITCVDVLPSPLKKTFELECFQL